MDPQIVIVVLKEVIALADGLVAAKGGFFLKMVWGAVKSFLETHLPTEEAANVLVTQMQSKGIQPH